MRKKFFAMYALVGALVASPVFTSCIDGEESSSVTAIRNANAEKIKSATALAQAQYEMEKAKADAEIAYKNALTEQQNLSNEQKKIQIEEAKAKAEAALLRAQADIIKATKELKDAENGVLNDLANDYTAALRSINTINKNIVNRSSDLAKLEAGLISVQAYVKAETTKLNNEIAGYEAAIKALDGVEGVDLTALKAEYKALEEAYNLALTKLEELEMQYGANASNTVTAKAMDFLTNTYYNTTAEGYPVLKEKEVAEKKADLAVEIEKAEKALADAIAEIGKDTDKKDTKYTYININPTTGVQTEMSALTLYAKLAKTKAETLGAPKAGDTPASGAYIVLEKLEAAVKDAKDALAANTDATQTATLEAAVSTAEANLLAYKTDKRAADDATAVDYDNDGNKDAGFAWAEKQVADAEKAIVEAKDELVNKEKDIATEKETSEKYEAAFAAFAGEDFETYKTALKELKAAEEAKDLAYDEYNTLYDLLYDWVWYYEDENDNGQHDQGEHEWWERQDELLYDVNQIIANYEAKIATAKAKLENLEQNISLPTGDGWNSWDNYSEEEVATLIEYVKNEIEALKVELSVAETEAKEAKAALDAYLATDEEGGEAEA